MIWMMLAGEWQYIHFCVHIDRSITSNLPDTFYTQQGISITHVTFYPRLEISCLCIKI